VVPELFARLSLTAFGALVLAGVIFYTAPRLRLSAWHGESRQVLATVGFNDQITLGGLGETIESRQEVMQLKLLDKASGEVYPLQNEVYLRGSAVAWYAHGHWRRAAPPQPSGDGAPSAATEPRNEMTYPLGPPVVQQITVEPYLDCDDIFYVWPLIKPVQNSLLFDPPSGRLMRKPTLDGELHNDNFKCELITGGLVDGRQADLIPASIGSKKDVYLQMPGDPLPLPRLRALASQWRQESGLPSSRHYDLARYFERQLSNSGQFQYSLQGMERDTSIDAIEDFVSNNRRGHCEYFATALALMLRSESIPSRVVLGYRCDEWHKDQQCFQVRQLHAHAWVEAFLAADQIPSARRENDPQRWKQGGWLRLDPTPGDEIGTQAAQRTAWGAMQGRWHGLQRFWDRYIVDMDRSRQRESVYEPLSRAMGKFTGFLFHSAWWKDLARSLWSSLANSLRSGIMGGLFVVLVLIALVVLPVAFLRWFARQIVRLWRRFSASGRKGSSGTSRRAGIEFYHRFEQIAARLGLHRAAGQTPLEFARTAGSQLAAAFGRSELVLGTLQVVEEFYRVRFGREELDASAAKALQDTLANLNAVSPTQKK